MVLLLQGDLICLAVVRRRSSPSPAQAPSDGSSWVPDHRALPSAVSKQRDCTCDRCIVHDHLPREAFPGWSEAGV